MKITNREEALQAVKLGDEITVYHDWSGEMIEETGIIVIRESNFYDVMFDDGYGDGAPIKKSLEDVINGYWHSWNNEGYDEGCYLTTK